ncbi:MAG: class I SAM-dependent methyltransferase [Proteobacteria bacterium]|jgi:2-polyprenyl-3-methyl-5-hydroxy-6-metoxy-1,4-benzoquinol methylase|nr:class I SAM-dependent methyltransferase [Pseudomonadota bacterium]
MAPIRDWEKLYQEEEPEKMPWFYVGLDPSFAKALTKLDIRTGRVLDLGTGPGTQAIALAEQGFSVYAVDISEAAIDKATLRARECGVLVTFRQDDFVGTKLTRMFDVVFDRGCFHSIDPDKRSAYVRNVFRHLPPGGILLLKTFSSLEPGDEGPFRFSAAQIREYFGDNFEVLSSEETEFPSGRKPKALFSVLRKK